MKRISKNEIKSRWTPEKIAEIEKAFTKKKVSSAQIAKVFGKTSRDEYELADLRGFPFREQYNHKTIADLDLEFCEWGVGFGIAPVTRADRCNFTNCKLDGALNSIFENCNFSKSRITGIHATSGTAFRNCDFRGCMFKEGFFHECEFIDCNFESAKMRKIEFENCFLESCEFHDCDFKLCTFGISKFHKPKNNFKYIHTYDFHEAPAEKIFDPNFSTVDFKDTLMMPSFD